MFEVGGDIDVAKAAAEHAVDGFAHFVGETGDFTDAGRRMRRSGRWLDEWIVGWVDKWRDRRRAWRMGLRLDFWISGLLDGCAI